MDAAAYAYCIRMESSLLLSDVHALSVTDSLLNIHSVPLCAQRLPCLKNILKAI